MSTQEAQSRRRYEDSIIDVLAYFVAARNYGYVDIIANALDPLTVREALINALRDFEAACTTGRERSSEKCAVCPKISEEELEKAVGIIEAKLSGGASEFMTYTRSLALKALARAPKFRTPECTGGSS